MPKYPITERRVFLTGLASVSFLPARAHAEGSGVREGDDNQEYLSLSSFVAAAAAGSRDATAALSTALRRAASEKRALLVDGRFAIRHDIPVPDGTHMMGRQGRDDGFDLLPAPATVKGGVHGYLKLVEGESTDQVVIEGLIFRSGFDRQNWSTSRVIPVIRSAPRAGVVHRGLAIRGCRFIDPVYDCIQISPEPDGRAEEISVTDCDVDVTIPLDRSSREADLIRTILYYQDWPGHKGSYGKVAIQGVYVRRCMARGIRTLADLKRGTANFEVSDCRTVDMHDCHHSTDGSFHGIFSRVEGVQRDALATAKNFIEVQGEDITIRDFSFDCVQSLGAIAGVMVTQYALPVEGRGVVHQSRHIRILEGKINGIAHHGIRLLNPDDVEVRNIEIRDVKLSGVSIESPPGGGVPRHILIDNLQGRGDRLSTAVEVAPKAEGVEIGRVLGFPWRLASP